MSASLFSKGRKIELDALAAAKHGRLSLPRIPPNPPVTVQSARSHKELPEPSRDRTSEDGHGSQSSRVIRKETLDILEDRWKTRQAPKQRSAKENVAPESTEAAIEHLRERSAGSSKGLEISSKPRSRDALGDTEDSAPLSRGSQSRGASPLDLDDDAEMAELRALMAANDLEAAEAKLQRIIDAAEEDGHID